ncbi:uncharacterized protein LOC142326839 [Lycorma delicatula]|uniref:uncharacterized protein LOC142326839 n=1 Tax=Lycorma delicatula TaxID=130591 RepID=UPI003F50F395
MAAGPPPGTPRWWGPPPAPHPPPASADVMNQLCRVCGEPAAGFHFGAFTCEGCKSFFGRTYNNINSISECKNNGECVINKKNRTSCKACRLRKCLLVGMSKSGSRYGRRSNWFKIHCLLQEQQQNQHTAVKPGKGWDGVAFHGKHILDIDNNNTPNTKDSSKDRSLSPMLLTPGSYNHSSGEAAAALWAARSSMLPVPHHPGLPFFAPSFLHNTSFHQPPPSPNFLLPFLPTRQPQQPEVPILSTSSSTSSSPSPEVQNKADKSTTTDLLNYDKCLSVLRSLGPVQETPMDLSLRTMDKHRDSDRESSNGDSDTSSKRKRNSGENSNSNKNDDEDVVKDVKPDDELEKKVITTPLDLTCTKS